MLTANPSGAYVFSHWLLENGTTDTANPYNLSLSGHTSIQAVFGVAVNNPDDGIGASTTPGTLRYALTNFPDDVPVIPVNVTAPIVLTSPLPITKSVTIEGNGATLTRASSWTSSDANSQLLLVNDGNNNNSVAVNISGIHFKDGLATTNGGAIQNNETLTLESCVFSGNRTTGNSSYGGAVYSAGNLTILGCTFYRNTAYRGGAVYIDGSRTLTLTGNLFYGNTATNSASVVYRLGGTFNASYNVTDAADRNAAGWGTITGDTTVYGIAVMPVSPGNFKLLSMSAAANKLPNPLPNLYPARDFYGDAINAGGAAGAVQATAINGGFYLGLSVNNDAWGSVLANPEPDEDGLVPSGPVMLTANPSGAYIFSHWLLENGTMVKTNPYTPTIADHTSIQAVFGLVVNNPSDDGTPGTLRYALNQAQAGAISMNLTDPIELLNALPPISQNLIIEGNGATLTRASSWTSSDANSQLLYIDSSATVKISGIHFKDGLATMNGAAIQNRGTLTLESCIFSGNVSTVNVFDPQGGAISNFKDLIVRGCTFYNNTAYRGGALASESGTYTSPTNLTLTGNLFYKDTPANNPVLYYSTSTYATLAATYNVVHVPFGVGTPQCGWAKGTGDMSTLDNDGDALTITGAPFDTATFYPVSDLQSFLGATPPAVFPETDFYGNVRVPGGAPGAVEYSAP
jgi:predicted outer membrane repeat protein